MSGSRDLQKAYDALTAERDSLAARVAEAEETLEVYKETSSIIEKVGYVDGLNAAIKKAAERGAREFIRAEELKQRWSKECHEIQQILGKALGYPWFKDDQANFPGATEADGVCVGEHVAASLAMEAADRIAEHERREAETVERCASVYLHTTGSGEDGNEWKLEAIYATKEAAERAKLDYDTTKHFRPDGTWYNLSSNDIEEWDVSEATAPTKGPNLPGGC